MAACSTTDLLPCEFCSELFSSENLLLHETECREILRPEDVLIASIEGSPSNGNDKDGDRHQVFLEAMARDMDIRERHTSPEEMHQMVMQELDMNPNMMHIIQQEIQHLTPNPTEEQIVETTRRVFGRLSDETPLVDTIPCQYCDVPLPAENVEEIMLHQTRCNSKVFETGVGLGVGVTCERCNEEIPFDDLIRHERSCGVTPTSQDSSHLQLRRETPPSQDISLLQLRRETPTESLFCLFSRIREYIQNNRSTISTVIKALLPLLRILPLARMLLAIGIPAQIATASVDVVSGVLLTLSILI
ncbi:unnamed protein product [Darwinula stevensoni]|uniref:Uncharacterized protein n=1 Tax=Darwinula stevensoni TaxID=69355 RepID=A0A7R8XCF7_9CRUS|nr:unnamed protein product [Darwinula stevensoni]CAG0891936.1 unnamed protein product [Darwinula stevensoni]